MLEAENIIFWDFFLESLKSSFFLYFHNDVTFIFLKHYYIGLERISLLIFMSIGFCLGSLGNYSFGVLAFILSERFVENNKNRKKVIFFIENRLVRFFSYLFPLFVFLGPFAKAIAFFLGFARYSIRKFCFFILLSYYIYGFTVIY